MPKQKIIIAIVGTALGISTISYIASIIFYALSGMGVEQVKPWSIWSYFEYSFDPTIQHRLLIALATPTILVVMIIATLSTKPEQEYGDAHWATWNEIKKAGLFSSAGIILGKYKGRYLISDSPTHVMLIAPTRSGKGIGLVIPNLLHWTGSLICLDVKNENFKKTAGFRAHHGQAVFMWSPLDPEGRSHRYNPLDAVSRDPYQRVSDIQVIAKILIKDPPKSDPIWASEARALFVGLALYVMENEQMPSTIGAINRLLGTEQDLGDVVRHIVRTHTELSDTIKKSLMNFANKAAKERSGVKSSLNQAINLWDNPIIDAATSASDFKIADLRKRKISIYVGVLTGQISTLSPLLRIFFEQIITLLSMHEPGKDEPHGILMMLDEFHMLGDMPSMTSAFTLLSGYNCRVIAAVQGIKWLDDVYGKDKRDGILSCCAHQVFFAANDLETANYVSNSCGDKTVKTISTSKKSSMKYEPPSKNTSFRARPLISKDKVKQLPRHEEIIITESSAPVRARKIEYFSDKNFRQRVMMPPAVPKLRILQHGIPHFDIPSYTPNVSHTPDPNQMEFFKENSANLSPNLSCWINETENPQEIVDNHKKDNSYETPLVHRFFAEFSEYDDRLGSGEIADNSTKNLG